MKHSPPVCKLLNKNSYKNTLKCKDLRKVYDSIMSDNLLVAHVRKFNESEIDSSFFESTFPVDLNEKKENNHLEFDKIISEEKKNLKKNENYEFSELNNLEKKDVDFDNGNHSEIENTNTVKSNNELLYDTTKKLEIKDCVVQNELLKYQKKDFIRKEVNLNDSFLRQNIIDYNLDSDFFESSKFCRYEKSLSCSVPECKYYKNRNQVANCETITDEKAKNNGTDNNADKETNRIVDYSFSQNNAERNVFLSCNESNSSKSIDILPSTICLDCKLSISSFSHNCSTFSSSFLFKDTIFYTPLVKDLLKIQNLLESIIIPKKVSYDADRSNLYLKEVNNIYKQHKLIKNSKNVVILNSKKLATVCVRELKRYLMKTLKTNPIFKGKRILKELNVFFKKDDKKKLSRKEIDEKDEIRAKKKLNFLINQTELFSHFMAKKETIREQINDLNGNLRLPDQNEENVTSDLFVDDTKDFEKAKMIALKAASKQKEYISQFNTITQGGINMENSDISDEKTLESNKTNILENLSKDLPLTVDNTATNLSNSDLQQSSILTTKLKHYQLQGLRWLVNLYDQGINGILADDMGLGKTIQSISFLCHLFEKENIKGPFLVVTPASTLHNWLSEIEKFAPTFTTILYAGGILERKQLRKNLLKVNIIVTSYQIVVSDYSKLKRFKFQYMILDEAQAIKSFNSIRWKTLLKIDCRNRLLLTGTPIQNTMTELWALLHFIMPTLFDNLSDFSDWFSKDIENKKIDANQLGRLHAILKPFMLRRVKDDVKDELGTKREVSLFCEMSHRQWKLYKRIENQKCSVDKIDSTKIETNEKFYKKLDINRVDKTINSNENNILNKEPKNDLDHSKKQGLGLGLVSQNNQGLGLGSELINDIDEMESESFDNSEMLDEISEEIINTNLTTENDEMLNVMMQFRKVCNHPDIFEKEEVETGLCFLNNNYRNNGFIFHNESKYQINLSDLFSRFILQQKESIKDLLKIKNSKKIINIQDKIENLYKIKIPRMSNIENFEKKIVENNAVHKNVEKCYDIKNQEEITEQRNLSENTTNLSENICKNTNLNDSHFIFLENKKRLKKNKIFQPIFIADKKESKFEKLEIINRCQLDEYDPLETEYYKYTSNQKYSKNILQENAMETEYYKYTSNQKYSKNILQKNSLEIKNLENKDSDLDERHKYLKNNSELEQDLITTSNISSSKINNEKNNQLYNYEPNTKLYNNKSSFHYHYKNRSYNCFFNNSQLASNKFFIQKNVIDTIPFSKQPNYNSKFVSIYSHSIISSLPRITSSNYILNTQLKQLSSKYVKTTHPLSYKIDIPQLNTFISSSGKLVILDLLLEKLKKEKHRCLIYFQMTKMMDLMEDYLIKRKYNYLRLDGSCRIKLRKELINEWQNNDEKFIFILSTRAGGLGINLTAADTVIFYDSDWNPTVDQQAMDRAHRLGQTKDVTVYRLIMKNTIEERVMEKAMEKGEIQNMVIKSGQFSNL